jgi:hypothetical protein
MFCSVVFIVALDAHICNEENESSVLRDGTVIYSRRRISSPQMMRIFGFFVAIIHSSARRELVRDALQEDVAENTNWRMPDTATMVLSVWSVRVVGGRRGHSSANCSL